MANTINVSVNSDSYTEVIASGSGIITNESLADALYAESDTEPDANFMGHTLRPTDFVSYELTTGQRVWVILKSGDGLIVVTPD